MFCYLKKKQKYIYLGVGHPYHWKVWLRHQNFMYVRYCRALLNEVAIIIISPPQSTTGLMPLRLHLKVLCSSKNNTMDSNKTKAILWHNLKLTLSLLWLNRWIDSIFEESHGHTIYHDRKYTDKQRRCGQKIIVFYIVG